ASLSDNAVRKVLAEAEHEAHRQMRRRHPAKLLALTAADKTRDPISTFGSIASHTLPISSPRHSLAAWRRRARRATRQAARAVAARDWEGNGNFVAGHKHD